MIGSRVTVKIDRPMGSYHPKHNDIYYPINYGYIEGIMAPDGEEQDAYVLGVVNVNIKMYKKWKIIMYIFSVILPLRMTQKALAYL